jgi:hypothetical protein
MSQSKNLGLWKKLSEKLPPKIGNFKMTFEENDDNLLRVVLEGDDNSIIVDGEVIRDKIYSYIRKLSRIIGLDPIWMRFDKEKRTQFQKKNQIDIKDIFDFDEFKINDNIVRYEDYREVKKSFYEILDSLQNKFHDKIVVNTPIGDYKLYQNKVSSQSWGEKNRDEIEVYFPITTELIELPSGERITDESIYEFMKSDIFTDSENYKEGYWSDFSPSDVLEYLTMYVLWAFIENSDSNDVTKLFWEKFTNNFDHYLYDTIVMIVNCVLNRLGEIKIENRFSESQPHTESDKLINLYKNWYNSEFNQS